MIGEKYTILIPTEYYVKILLSVLKFSVCKRFSDLTSGQYKQRKNSMVYSVINNGDCHATPWLLPCYIMAVLFYSHVKFVSDVIGVVP